jgi:hypothetical protein
MAAKSIIEVEIDPKGALDAFQKKFSKYHDMVKDLPGAWGEQAEAVGETASTFLGMTAALMAQRDILKEQEKALKRVADEEKRAAAEAKKRADRWKEMGKDAVSLTRQTFAITGEMFKWVGIGSVVGGLLGAGGLWGLDKLAASIGDQRRSAMGVGISVPEQQALNLQFGRYADVNTDVENVANAKNDRSKWGWFSAMGVKDWQTKNPADLFVEMMNKARSLYMGSDHSAQFAQAHGLTQFFSMDELRRFGNTSDKEWNGAQKDYRQTVKDLAPLSDRVARAWQGLSITLEKSKLTVENAFIGVLTRLVPTFEKWSNLLTKWLTDIAHSPDLGKWIDTLATKLEDFATYLGSSEFRSKVQSWLDKLEDIINGLYDKMVQWGFIHPRPETPGGANVDAGEAAAIARSPTHRAQQLLITAELQKLLGVSRAAAAGDAMNMWDESGFNPLARNGTHYGLYQWDSGRQKEFAEIFHHTMESVRDPRQAMKEEMEFHAWEMRNAYKKVFDAFRDVNDTDNGARIAGYYLSRDYETPSLNRAANERIANQRGQQAVIMYHNLKIENKTGNDVTAQIGQVPQ